MQYIVVDSAIGFLLALEKEETRTRTRRRDEDEDRREGKDWSPKGQGATISSIKIMECWNNGILINL